MAWRIKTTETAKKQLAKLDKTNFTPVNLRGIDLNLSAVFEAAREGRSQIRAAQRPGMTRPVFSNALARLRRLVLGRPKGLAPAARADGL